MIKSKQKLRLLRIKMSIKNRLLLAFGSVLMVAFLLLFVLLQSSYSYIQRYSELTKNITKANQSALLLKNDIYSELYKIIIGTTALDEGIHNQVIMDVQESLRQIQSETIDTEQRGLLETSIRTINGLKEYVFQLETSIRSGAYYEENFELLEKVDNVVQLSYGAIQEYIFTALNNYEEIRVQMYENIKKTTLSASLFLLAISIVATFLVIRIVQGIYRPINRLHHTIKAVETGDFDARLDEFNELDEIATISNGFNQMMKKINEFREKENNEQKERSLMELRLLQLQINPHFLYNTLDTIIWSTELNNRKQTINLVKALSSFFRTALSNGADWITMKEEIEHIKSYLTIQKIRYQDILEVEFNIDNTLDDFHILKLLLQPLVENALYHGIKNKRGKGKICITTKRVANNHVLLEVLDNGVGISEQRLSEVRMMMNTNMTEKLVERKGFGLSNVNHRILLNYNLESGLQIDSEQFKGTRVWVILPLMEK